MVMLPLSHICLIYTKIEFPHQGGPLHQGADKAYVILLPEATYVSQNGLFALLIRFLSSGRTQLLMCALTSPLANFSRRLYVGTIQQTSGAVGSGTMSQARP